MFGSVTSIVISGQFSDLWRHITLSHHITTHIINEATKSRPKFALLSHHITTHMTEATKSNQR
jgi:hypothetical protein